MLLSSYLVRIQSRCDRTQLSSCARHGPFDCAQGRLARAPVPTLALAILTILALSAGLWAIPAPKTATPVLHTVRMVQQSIPMPDGVHLSATLYMPGDAKPGEKFPALLEYLPYRKDDATAARDYPIHTWFAARGYVSVRVDIRGFGASEGTPTDREYSEQEQLDGEQVIAWLAAQPWSTGKVGMFGISWGGFNSIQLAMRHPPALKAILAVDATEQLFHDDVHYIDGMMHFDEFELNMDLAPSMTGAPDYSLDEKILGPRFESAPWSLMYFKHQRDGQFWHAPVRPLSEIKIPCFLIGGLLDGYRDSIPRMFEQVKAPVKAIIGPWNHTFPNDAEPGPQIEWRDQALRWWDYWLKSRNTGIMEEPPLSIYMQEWHAPDPHLKIVPGKWRGEIGWPPRNVANTTLYLYEAHVLSTDPAKSAVHQLRYVPIRWRGSRILVGRTAHRPAPRRRLQPHLRFRSAQNRPHHPRTPSRPASGKFVRSASRLVRPPLRRSSRRHRHPSHRSRTQRRAARVCLRTERLSPQPDLLAGYRNAPGHMDFPCRPSHSSGSFERALANGLANSLRDDDQSSTRRWLWITPDPAASSTVHVRRASIRAPRAVRTTQRHSVRGLSLARRLENRARRTQWKNKSDLEWKVRRNLPLGKRNRLRRHNLPR